MRRLLFLFLLTTSVSALADWTAVTKDPKGATYYLDLTTIRKKGSTVKVWGLSDFPAPQKFRTYTYSSAKDQYEYDCDEEIARLLYLSLHSGQMGQDEALYRDVEAENWHPVPPDSIHAFLMHLVCK